MKIALIGYGKMGKEIEAAAILRGHSIVLKVDSKNASSYTDQELTMADIAIEFSQPAMAMDSILRCLSLDLPIVVGTTGWYEKLNDVKQLVLQKKQAFLYASNFSIGVNLFFELNKQLATLMKEQKEYSVGIQEIHHLQKLDSPSGTAITLAEDLLLQFPQKNNWANTKITEKETIGIESLRMEGVPGTHTIQYNSEIDSIEIKHTAHNRKGFALGSVIAAEWLNGKKGFYTMRDVLGYS